MLLLRDLEAADPLAAAKVAIVGTCWEWQGSRDRGGYGRLGRRGKVHAAHRYVYEILVGEIPAGLDIDHLCRNHACCNPGHLEPVDRRTNLLRGVGFIPARAAQTSCMHGHEFTEANTRVDPNGTRHCKICDRIRRRRNYHRRKGVAHAASAH